MPDALSTALQARPSHVAGLPDSTSGRSRARSMRTPRNPGGAPSTRTRRRCWGSEANDHRGSAVAARDAVRVVSGPRSDAVGPRNQTSRDTALSAASRAHSFSARGASPACTSISPAASESGSSARIMRGRMCGGAHSAIAPVPAMRPRS